MARLVHNGKHSASAFPNNDYNYYKQHAVNSAREAITIQQYQDQVTTLKAEVAFMETDRTRLRGDIRVYVRDMEALRKLAPTPKETVVDFDYLHNLETLVRDLAEYRRICTPEQVKELDAFVPDIENLIKEMP